MRKILSAITTVLLTAMPGVYALAQDSAVPASVKRVPPDRLGHYWLLDPDSAIANVPNSGYGLDAPTCVAVSYLIDNNGKTGRIKLERAVPPGPLAKVAFNVVTGMRFAATKENAGREPVYTYVVMPFNLPPAGSANPADKALRARTLDPCNLADFVPPAK